jgi:hypothetical protein
MLTLQKKTLSAAEIDAQSAFELPERETLALVNVFVTNVLNGVTINIPVQNNHVAVQVCAVIDAITQANMATLTCTVTP